MKQLFFLSLTLCLVLQARAQAFRFAHVTDTHVGGSTGAEDLVRTVQDINGQPGIGNVAIMTMDCLRETMNFHTLGKGSQ